jgi:medium-chain acyl-[acyl-carrier-protein] hydrolase
VNSSNPWIAHRIHNPLARLRLFCFHHAGGAASAFREWNRRLPSSIDVCPVQLPGHSTRMHEPLARDLDRLTEAATDGLLPELLEPFVFFGHSLGALVAFRVARELAARGVAGPHRLFVAARAAPGAETKRLALSDLPDRDFVHEMKTRYNAIPDAISNDPELLALFLPTLRADFRLHETYVHRPGAPLSCGISAYGGVADSNVSEEQLEAWQRETAGRFSSEMFDGGHFFVHAADSRFMDSFTRALVMILRRADYERSG